jgi:hypothetical protein
VVVSRPSPNKRENAGEVAAGSRDHAPVWALHGELTARPPGRLGRRLLPEIESYLEFFAISRETG